MSSRDRIRKYSRTSRRRDKRSWEAVGRFMKYWGELEGELNRSIRRCYGLRFPEGSIITGNVNARDKVHILRSAVDYFSRDIMSKEWRDQADQEIGRIFEFIAARNLVAHTAFQRSGKGNVEFLRVQAKGSYREESPIWTLDKIKDQCQKMDEICDALRHLAYELREERRNRGLIRPRRTRALRAH
jgi:hypothetical protein